ncbi:UNKNOWN [Stylonychia lemnae]|uniref:Uncharacterized protein n=1 Tax=Stylonychia lemnae TaxID=5949 RepID=A0A077ZMP6_STYLE|nr:UNKNOWN [Stylonychia lemnae]|eukprot:CDW71208.1 UNKNOWN [Stylonychia lemnae]
MEKQRLTKMLKDMEVFVNDVFNKSNLNQLVSDRSGPEFNYIQDNILKTKVALEKEKQEEELKKGRIKQISRGILKLQIVEKKIKNRKALVFGLRAFRWNTKRARKTKSAVQNEVDYIRKYKEQRRRGRELIEQSEDHMSELEEDDYFDDDLQDGDDMFGQLGRYMSTKPLDFRLNTFHSKLSDVKTQFSLMNQRMLEKKRMSQTGRPAQLQSLKIQNMYQSGLTNVLQTPIVQSYKLNQSMQSSFKHNSFTKKPLSSNTEHRSKNSSQIKSKIMSSIEKAKNYRKNTDTPINIQINIEKQVNILPVMREFEKPLDIKASQWKKELDDFLERRSSKVSPNKENRQNYDIQNRISEILK